MAGAEEFSDDYVAGLLAKDAQDRSLKYSSMGMEAFLSSSKAPASKPKPNMRFLRNIIRETDNHNAALLKKEAAESRARLVDLETKDARSSVDIRKRQLGQITALLRGVSKKGQKTRYYEKGRLVRRNTSSEDEPEEEEQPVEKGKKDEKIGHSHSREAREERGREDSSTSKRRERKRHRSPSEDVTDDESERKGKRSQRRSRSRSPKDHRSSKIKDKESRSRHRSRSPSHRHKSKWSKTTEQEESEEEHGRKHRKKHRHRADEEDEEEERKHHKKSRKSKHKAVSNASDSDSDPLASIIGPLPPKEPTIRSRGRGTIGGKSNMDRRFSASYDPSADVGLDDDDNTLSATKSKAKTLLGDGEDWDLALEALRDRQRWRAQGADRLRAAGFTEEQIGKWEKSGDGKKEKGWEDVKWKKKGEGREWDKGKVGLSGSEDGEEDGFGRLKGN